MKHKILPIFFLCFLLVFVTPAYAYSFEDIASWFSNFFRITGYQVYENETTTTTTTEATTTTEMTTTTQSLLIREQVKCIFTDTDAMQKCYTNDGKFGCSGTGSCIADVAGESGTKLVWKSSCPDVS